MQFFKPERVEIYRTSMNLASYREMVNKYRNLYVKDTDDGLEVEWKLSRSRGIYVTAICKFIPGPDENTIEVTAKIKHATFYQIMIVLWIVLGGLWIIFIPSISSLQSFLFGLLVVIGLWSFAASNRNTLLKNLSPN